MVRLEKIAYEQIVNSQTLGRARQLTTPAKWFTTNPILHNRSIHTLIKNSHRTCSTTPYWEKFCYPSTDYGITMRDHGSAIFSYNED
jgi:hypothetical protein